MIRRLIDVFYDHFPLNVEISIGDIMHKRDEMTYLQFAVSALYLDVINYCRYGDDSFFYQNELKKYFEGCNYDQDYYNKRFQDVIDSCLLNGFNKESYLFVDKEINLSNGSHRTAICLYLGIYQLKAKSYQVKNRHFKLLKDHILLSEFPFKTLNEINDAYKGITDFLINNGVSMCAILPQELKIDGIIDMISVKKFKLKQSGEIIIAGMTLDTSKNYLLYLFTLKAPQYKVKNGRVLSMKMVNIEKVLKKEHNVNFIISKNCSEGKEYFDMVKNLII